MLEMLKRRKKLKARNSISDLCETSQPPRTSKRAGLHWQNGNLASKHCFLVAKDVGDKEEKETDFWQKLKSI